MWRYVTPHLLVEVLAEAGVRRMYGVSGDSLNEATRSDGLLSSLTFFQSASHRATSTNQKCHDAGVALTLFTIALAPAEVDAGHVSRIQDSFAELVIDAGAPTGAALF